MPQLTNKETKMLMFAAGLLMGYGGHYATALLGGAIGILLMMFILRNQ